MSDMDARIALDPTLEKRACEVCNEESDSVGPLTVHHADGSIGKLYACADCEHDQMTTCVECEHLIWAFAPDMVRIGSETYCADCASRHPAIVGSTMAGILAEEWRDRFNETRR